MRDRERKKTRARDRGRERQRERQKERVDAMIHLQSNPCQDFHTLMHTNMHENTCAPTGLAVRKNTFKLGPPTTPQKNKAHTHTHLYTHTHNEGHTCAAPEHTWAAPEMRIGVLSSLPTPPSPKKTHAHT